MKQERKNLPIEKKRGGFTMVELLLVVAILTVLFGLAVGGLLQMRKNLRQKELDAKAEIIYAAAQNRMAELRAAGYADAFEPEENNTKGIGKLEDYPEDMDQQTLQLPESQRPAFYWVSSEDKNESDSTAALLLTRNTVDEELWNANWIIEYNGKTGQVYAVFYSEENLANFREESFRQRARTYSNRLKDGAKVGYYGGDLTLQSSTSILRPTISIINDEELTAHFVCRSPDLRNGWHPRLVFEITITDIENKASTTLTVEPKVINNVYTADLVLDSLEPGQQHFYQRFPQESTGLVPGHNLEIKIVAKVPTSEGLTSEENPDCVPDTRITNSLFADRKDVSKNGRTENTAYIRVRRHLQNLDTATSHVVGEINAGQLENDISFRKAEGTGAASFYSFKPINNASLRHFYGTDNPQTGAIFSIKDLYLTGANSAGLFEQYQGEIVDLVMANTRTVGAYTAGAFVGTVTGNTTLTNCWAYLTNLSTTKYSSPENVPDYIRATYAGGLVGSVNTGVNLTVNDSAAATVVNAASGAAGGVAGVVRGSLTLNRSYTDCYLKGDYTGGIVGIGPNATLSLKSFYTTGYQVANIWAGGVIPGSVASGSYTDGYCAVNYPAKNGTPTTVYPVAGTGRASNISYLEILYDNPQTAPRVEDRTGAAEKTGEQLSASTMTVSGDFAKGVGTTAYDFLDQGLTQYPYPGLAGKRHYGDWETQVQNVSFVYYERYADGTFGVYGSGLRLSGTKEIVGDGYGILLSDEPKDGYQYQVTYQTRAGGEKTLSYTASDNVVRTVTDTQGKKYYLITVTPRSSKGSGDAEEYFDGNNFITDDIRRETGSFYAKVEILYRPYNDYSAQQVTQTFYFNPYFAKTVVQTGNGDTVPQTPNYIYLRTARHLVALSNLFSEETTVENGGLHDFPGVVANTSENTYTFLQERTIDLDGNYRWSNFANRDKPVSIAPISGESYKFNSTYNGQSLEIRNFPILSKSLYTGLFGYIGPDGAVENVVLSGGYDADKQTYESIVYQNGTRQNSLRYSTDELRMGALAGLNAGTISNCAVSGYEMKLYAYQKSFLHLGGLVGVNAGTIQNTSADTAKIQLSFDGSGGNIGTLAGRNLASASIRQSYAFGIINVTDCTDSDVSVSGMVGVNYGVLRDSYCGTAFDVSGTAKTYGFTPRNAGATVDRCYFFDGGTYSYAQKYYSFNVSNSENAGKAISSENLKDEALTGFRVVADGGHTGNHPNTTTETFEYRSSVTGPDGQAVHYGNWPNHEKSMGTVGVFYWEYEEGGHSGYHLSYLGYDGAAGKVVTDNTLCAAHDDGGVITRFGYGYFLKDDVENIDITRDVKLEFEMGWNFPEKDTDVAAALQAQLPQYQFIAYETGSDKLSLQSAKQNSTWWLTYNNKSYTFSLSPFFANAMGLSGVIDEDDNVKWSGNATPGITTAYQIRSVAQLQFINWNYAKKSATTRVDATRSYHYDGGNNTYQYEYSEETTSDGTVVNRCYPYLVTNNDSAKATIVQLKWVQTHDVNAHSANFTPIGSMYDKAVLDTGSSDPLIAYFGSTYDGQDYTIMNVQIQTKAQMVGLFGITSGAKLSNIVLYSNEGNTIGNTADGENWYSIGGLVGFAAKGDNVNAAFTNCTVSGYKILDQRAKGQNITAYRNSSGIFNWNLPGWGGACIGGLTGSTNMDISNCTAVTDITIQVGYNVGYMNIRVGGIVGSSRGSLTGCYAGGSIQDKTTLNNYYADPTWGANIWVGGLVGGVILRNEGTEFEKLVGSTSGSMSVSNCYSYVELPASYKANTNNKTLIKNVQSIASNGEMLYPSGVFGGVNNSAVTITNSYCYIQNALLSDDYAIIGISQTQNNKYTATRNAQYAVTYENTHNPYLTYDEMAGAFDLNDGKTSLAELIGNGSKVTVEENGATVNGKYSFPGGDAVLEGKNYPFPTVLTQNGGSVNVHYGRWPKLGLYWTVNSGEIDLFKDREEVQANTLEDLSQERPVVVEDFEPLPEGTVTEHITYPDPDEENQQLPPEPQGETPEGTLDLGIAAFEMPAVGAGSQTPAENPPTGGNSEEGAQNPGVGRAATDAAQTENKTYISQKNFQLQKVDVGGTMGGTPTFTYYTEDLTQEITENPLAEVVSASAYDGNNISNVTIRANRPGTIVIQASQNGYNADLIVTVTATLKIRLTEADFTVYEGEPITAEVSLTNEKKDAQGNEELVILTEDQLTWRTQTVGGATASWSVTAKENDPGKYILTVTGVHAGTLRVPLSAAFRSDKDSTEIELEAVNFDVTVKPSIVLGLGDGEQFSQVSVPKLPVGGETVDGTTPGSEDVQPVPVEEDLYLYATRDYATIQNLVIQRVTINDDVLTKETTQQLNEEAQSAALLPEEAIAVQLAPEEEPLGVHEPTPLAADLPEGEHYVGRQFVLTVGPVTGTADGKADYRTLTVTDLDGSPVESQWTLRLVFGRVDDQGQTVPGSYRLTYERPNTLRFYLTQDAAAPQLTEKVKQDGILDEDRLTAINAELRTAAENAGIVTDPGYYLVWEQQGKIVSNLDIYPQRKGIPYQIVYDANFENWNTYLDSIGPSAHTYGESVALLSYLTNRPGYSFDGWYKDSQLTQSAQVVDGSLTFFTGEGTQGEHFIPTTPGEQLTLYAKWVPNSYTITYIAGQDATGDVPENKPLTYGDKDYVIPTGDGLAKAGCRFNGWYYLDAEDQKIFVTSGEPCPYVPSQPEDTLTLYADWVEETTSDEPSEEDLIQVESGKASFPPIPPEGTPEPPAEGEEPGQSANGQTPEQPQPDPEPEPEPDPEPDPEPEGEE